MTRTAIRRTYTFTVRGMGLFPFDMLRYDRCTPKPERDSHVIEDSRWPRSAVIAQPTHSVTLTGPKPPTEGRWASFGWEVESVE